MADGLEALTRLQEEPEAFDLLWTDAMMPQMDGFELVQTLRTNHKTQYLPVVLMVYPPNDSGFSEARSRLFVVHTENPPLLFVYKWPDKPVSLSQKVKAALDYLIERGFLSRRSNTESDTPDTLT